MLKGPAKLSTIEHPLVNVLLKQHFSNIICLWATLTPPIADVVSVWPLPSRPLQGPKPRHHIIHEEAGCTEGYIRVLSPDLKPPV